MDYCLLDIFLHAIKLMITVIYNDFCGLSTGKYVVVRMLGSAVLIVIFLGFNILNLRHKTNKNKGDYGIIWRGADDFLKLDVDYLKR